MSNQKVDLIRQALGAAESSIRLAKQLLNEIEKGDSKPHAPVKEAVGILGTFDGQELQTENGEKLPVPENYASKSILVVGDTLKLVEEGKEKRFKQIEHVKRHKTTGILTKKDGKWTAVTPEGSYKLLPAAVAHFGAQVGDEALLQLPASNLQVPWAALEKVTKKADGTPVEEKKTEEPKEDKSAEKAKVVSSTPPKKEEKPKETKAPEASHHSESKPKVEEPKEKPQPVVEKAPEAPKPVIEVIEKAPEPKPEVATPVKAAEEPKKEEPAPPIAAKPEEKASVPPQATPIAETAPASGEDEEELA